jgi:N-acetylmuramoyl-L-alanine amidase
LMSEFSISVDNVIGHRELNTLAEKNIIPSRYKTSKSCPGTKINMHAIRDKLAQTPTLIKHERTSVDENSKIAMNNAIAILQKHRAQFPNAQDELDEFINHPEVISMTRA